MNEKWARELLGPDREENGKTYKVTEDLWLTPAHQRAAGYLEALEKARGLEKTLKRFSEGCNPDCSCAEEAKEALTEWEKRK